MLALLDALSTTIPDEFRLQLPVLLPKLVQVLALDKTDQVQIRYLLITQSSVLKIIRATVIEKNQFNF